VRRNLDGEPALEEIRKVVKTLKASGPGCSGVSAAEWKALLADEESEGWVVQCVQRFWRCRKQPSCGRMAASKS
jgi:hypothetical protein